MSVALVLVLGVSSFVYKPGGSTVSGTSSSGTNSSGGSSATSGPLTKLSNVEVSPQPFDWGDISMKNGVVNKTFTLKNKVGQNLKVAKIETSCMCTQASMKIGDKESPYFGMPGHTSNSGWQADIPKDGEAQVSVKFNPNAHGPSGTGPFNRVVRVFLSDPQNTYVDINFQGEVIK